MNGNTYKDLINDTCTSYDFPYPKGTHVIISDGGIYFPSQYCNELNRDYKGQPMFAALSRQLGEGCQVHANTQAYGRLWDKMREQCVRFLNCEWCVHIFGFVIQRVTFYDKADSCSARIKPCRVPVLRWVIKMHVCKRVFIETNFSTNTEPYVLSCLYTANVVSTILISLNLL